MDEMLTKLGEHRQAVKDHHSSPTDGSYKAARTADLKHLLAMKEFLDSIDMPSGGLDGQIKILKDELGI